MDREVIRKPKKRGVWMKRQVAYKQGYKIVICGKFYEVMDVKRVLHYGNLSHVPTVQEVWNKTIGLEQEQFQSRQRIDKGRLLYEIGGNRNGKVYGKRSIL